MTTHYLAIPVVGLAVSSFLFSTHAQSMLDAPNIGSPRNNSNPAVAISPPFERNPGSAV